MWLEQAKEMNFMTSEHQHKVYQIIVNGEQKEVTKKHLTFQDVCELAFPEGPFADTVVYTVTFSFPDGTEGSMVKHESVKIENGVIFHVGNTDKS